MENKVNVGHILLGNYGIKIVSLVRNLRFEKSNQIQRKANVYG